VCSGILVFFFKKKTIKPLEPGLKFFSFKRDEVILLR